ncbi:MAG: M6 family metalloprotease domain-containing protein, partial [Candidatus Krumholzibacteria bacterium]|nr:M6 family metalloprotease domain-containing protein [Candidatus Krumholzibacteria bacterium]
MLPAIIAPAVLFGAGAVRGIVPPRGGGPMPDGFRSTKTGRPDAFTLRRGWIERARAAEQARSRAPLPGYRPMTTEPRAGLIGPGPLSGTLRVPVIGARYGDYADPPYSLASLQAELFDGPWTTGTLSRYYSEASGGVFTVTGDVRGWVPLAQAEDYYTGGPAQGLVPEYLSPFPGLFARTDEMISEAVAGIDAEVDFGRYDNDGPDGVPNSGDDDGFVDVLIVVHPSVGAECANSLHMWSHSWQYSLWREGGQPLPTGDPAAGGGTILVDDYIVAPIVSCDDRLIEIGVFCHELGHALGLPDLYDYNGGSSGIGYWGLMGSGNWNRPESPAHPSGWCKERLGWVDVVDIGWEARELTLGPVINSRTVARLDLPTRRFRRAVPAASPTGAALVCGYTVAEATARGWPGGAGYGNEWEESISREFVFDGARPVTLEYAIQTDLEEGYDFAYTLLRVGSAPAETLATLTGVNALGPVLLELDPYLPEGAVATGCEISFLLRSDFNFSDEDGRYRSVEGRALLVDDIRVTGGGVDYFADFTVHAGGWHETSAPAEYFIVERRTRTGFDAHLKGEGLLIWHAEPSTACSYVGNSGG